MRRRRFSEGTRVAAPIETRSRLGGYDAGMSKLLLNLRHVPDDEADEIRVLLDARRITFFETRPSRWGVSAGSIWITDDDDLPAASQIMDEYQAQRLARVRSELAVAQRDGTAPTTWKVVRDDPARLLLALLAAAFAIGLLALPVFLLWRWEQP
jgi:hypothetical protein